MVTRGSDCDPQEGRQEQCQRRGLGYRYRPSVQAVAARHTYVAINPGGKI